MLNASGVLSSGAFELNTIHNFSPDSLMVSYTSNFGLATGPAFQHIDSEFLNAGSPLMQTPLG